MTGRRVLLTVTIEVVQESDERVIIPPDAIVRALDDEFRGRTVLAEHPEKAESAVFAISDIRQ